MNKLKAPFIHNGTSSVTVLLDMLTASLPVILWSVYVFGKRCISIYCLSVLSALLTDLIYIKLVRRKKYNYDFSALITGLVVAFAMPVSVPLWLPPLASFGGILVSKCFFGGTGKNIFNPAATGICLVYPFFHDKMNVFTKPFVYMPALKLNVDTQYIAANRVFTVIDEMKAGSGNPTAIMDEFYGLTPGFIGGVSFLILAIALVYLIIRKAIHINSAFSYILSFMLFSMFICYADCEPTEFMELQLFSGSSALIMVYMLNDYSTTPKTGAGRVIFGALLGIGVVFARWKIDLHYGEFFIVLALNLLAPVIDKLTYQRVFGTKIRKKL